MLRRAAFWIPVPLVGIVCIPWYFYTYEMAKEGWRGSTAPKFLFGTVMSTNARELLAALGIGICVLAVLGLYERVIKPWLETRDPGAVWASLFGLVGSVWIFHNFLAPVRDVRHFLPAVAAILLFAAAGAKWILGQQSFLPIRMQSRPTLIGLTAVGVSFLQVFSVPQKGIYGAIPVSDLISSRAYAGANVLVSSSNLGEGAVIAETAMREHAPHRRIVRGTKVLASVEWDGQRYQLAHSNARDVIKTFERSRVKLLVVDKRLSEAGKYAPHHIQLTDVIRSFPDRFHRIYPGIADTSWFEILEFR